MDFEQRQQRHLTNNPQSTTNVSGNENHTQSHPDESIVDQQSTQILNMMSKQ